METLLVLVMAAQVASATIDEPTGYEVVAERWADRAVAAQVQSTTSLKKQMFWIDLAEQSAADGIPLTTQEQRQLAVTTHQIQRLLTAENETQWVNVLSQEFFFHGIKARATGDWRHEGLAAKWRGLKKGLQRWLQRYNQ